MKRNTDQMSKNDNEKKRGSTSTPKNPQKKQKNDDAEMKAKRQINFKTKDSLAGNTNKDHSHIPVSISKPILYNSTNNLYSDHTC